MFKRGINIKLTYCFTERLANEIRRHEEVFLKRNPEVIPAGYECNLSKGRYTTRGVVYSCLVLCTDTRLR
ncbi:hypothetical protein J6590_091530 [Homalodisca vitripennis]|nr:hypothetical protein J6590_091530 [Homalodisca vitripennis]